MIAREIEKLLEARYSQPDWAYFSQVRSSTGTASRVADGIAMHMYASRSHEINGFEIKVSRSDWLNELKNPQKAEGIFKYCDRWWIVTSDKDIVQEGELPKGWGLIVMRKNGLVKKVGATLTEGKQLDIGFVAALLRRAAYDQERHIYKDEIKDELKAASERGKEGRDYEVESLEGNLSKKKKIIEAFEKGSGVKLSEWDATESAEVIGKYVRQAIADKKFDLSWNIDGAIRALESALEDVRELKGIFPKKRPEE